MNKKCSRCGVIRPISEYANKKTNKDGKNKTCKKCKSYYNKNLYKLNKDKIVENNNIRKKNIRKVIDSFKNECLICGDNRTWILEFHHINPSLKSNNISRMVSAANSLKSIIKEIEKCIILCSNCHKDIHYKLRKKDSQLN